VGASYSLRGRPLTAAPSGPARANSLAHCGIRALPSLFEARKGWESPIYADFCPAAKPLNFSEKIIQNRLHNP